MRWNQPKVGALRVRRRFFFLPHSLSGQVLWLEFAWVVEERQGGCMYAGTGPMWWPIRLATEKEVHIESMKSQSI